MEKMKTDNHAPEKATEAKFYGDPFTKEEASKFFGVFYNGEHHLPSEVKPWGQGWTVNHRGDLASFDFSEMTRLVVMAHDCCVRISISPCKNDVLRICIWKRHSREGDMSLRHPDLESAIKTFRDRLKGDEDYEKFLWP
jgi:hypothetical protein